ncbi:MAG: hypothetical protein ACK5Y2_00550 [Bdellovibrionales bacterium]
MKLSQIDTLFVILLLVTSQFAFAQGSDFESRLKTLLATQKGQVSNQKPQPSLRVPDLQEATKGAAQIEVRPVQNLTVPSAQKAQNPRSGGISGGGGNSVGNRLFDFYESLDSVEVKLDQLLELEPLVQEKINFINASLFRGPGTTPFFESLKRPLGQKRLSLETRDLTEPSCVNQSLISTPQQVVQACQSNLQVKFNLNWMSDRATAAEDRAGLIFHEIFLAYLHSKNPKLEVSDAELNERVRLFNSDLFRPGIDSRTLAGSFNRYFNDLVLSDSEKGEADSAAPKVEQILQSFCQDLRYDVAGQFKIQFRDFEKILPHLSETLQTRALTVQMLSDDYRTTFSKKDPSRHLLALFRDQVRELCQASR